MICPACRHDNPPGEQFCARCKLPLVSGGPKFNKGCLWPILLLTIAFALSVVVFILVRQSEQNPADKLIGPATQPVRSAHPVRR
jgi:hypothetical protein